MPEIFYYRKPRKLIRVTRLNRLITSYSPRAGIAANYSYNALNQRVYKCRPQKCSHYLFNDSGELVYDNLPVSPNYYIYLDGQVVSLINNGQIYAVEDDYLGRPEVITDAAKTIVWKAVNYDFSREMSINKITFYLGFPGQYYDVDTDLWYNWNRWYDAKLGRYLQSDPIGLDGGINTYAYAGNNPVSFVDPTGLDWVYSQSTGQLSHIDGAGNVTNSGTGYAGHGQGLNNPANQFVPGGGSSSNAGPLPRGTYTIQQKQNNVTGTGVVLPNSMRLVPSQENSMGGRAGFLIHGGNMTTKTSSQGCIVAPPNVRNEIGASGDNVLRVVQ